MLTILFPFYQTFSIYSDTILKVEATRTVRNWESFIRKKTTCGDQISWCSTFMGRNGEELGLVSFDSRSQDLCG